MFAELRELLCNGAIRRYQLGAKDLLTPTSYYVKMNKKNFGNSHGNLIFNKKKKFVKNRLRKFWEQGIV